MVCMTVFSGLLRRFGRLNLECQTKVAKKTPQAGTEERIILTTLILTLGASQSWNTCTPGKWVRKLDDRGNATWVHEPAVHEVKCDEKTADGLIQAAKEWEEWTKQHDPRGDIRRMIKVSDVKRNVEPDPDPDARLAGTAIQRFADTMEKQSDRFLEGLAKVVGSKKA